MEGVETWLSSQAADFFDTGIQNLIPGYEKASIPAVTTLRSSLNMYVRILTTQRRLLSEQPSYIHQK
jgi:hypothetical protein